MKIKKQQITLTSIIVMSFLIAQFGFSMKRPTEDNATAVKHFKKRRIPDNYEFEKDKHTWPQKNSTYGNSDPAIQLPIKRTRQK